VESGVYFPSLREFQLICNRPQFLFDKEWSFSLCRDLFVTSQFQVSFESIPESRKYSFEALDANCGPLSKIKESESPNREKSRSINSCAVCSESIDFEQGMKIAPFVRPWSTKDKIALNLLISCRSVMKSMLHWAKTHHIIIKIK
jgi:hypothetical protein